MKISLISLFVIFYFAAFSQTYSGMESEKKYDIWLYKNTGIEFQEVNGIVSIEAENATRYNNVVFIEGESGLAALCPGSGTKNFGMNTTFLRFHIWFSQPGKYNLYILARKCVSDATHPCHGNEAQIRINPDTTFLLPSLRADNGIPEGAPLSWFVQDQNGIKFTRMTFEEAQGNGILRWRSSLKSSRPVQGKMAEGPAVVEITKAGLCILEIIAANESGWAVDKLVLNKNNRNPPVGTGPFETRK